LSDIFLQIFQQSKTILCLCPKCNSLVRFSDLHLRSKEKPPKTWLDDYEFNLQKIREHERDFDGKEGEIREKAAERGRLQVPEIIKKSMHSQFAKLPYDPYDIKPLLHPVEFAIFDGMNKGSLNNIVLLSRLSTNQNLQNLQKTVAKAVEERLYDWKVARVDLDGNVEFE